MQKDGDIAKPVMTQFGWHIIRRIDKKDVPSCVDAKADIKKRVEKDSRSQEAKTVLIDRIKRENNYSEVPGVRAALIAKIDSGITRGNWKDSVLHTNQTLFTLPGEKLHPGKFVEYMEKNAKRRSDKGKVYWLMNITKAL